MMKDGMHYAPASAQRQKVLSLRLGFHDAKTAFHIVKNTIAQHHESISFSEISFRIAKSDI
jgi:hypothetical protein